VAAGHRDSPDDQHCLHGPYFGSSPDDQHCLHGPCFAPKFAADPLCVPNQPSVLNQRVVNPGALN
jgi:hypothetical protein